MEFNNTRAVTVMRDRPRDLLDPCFEHCYRRRTSDHIGIVCLRLRLWRSLFIMDGHLLIELLLDEFEIIIVFLLSLSP
jgi:hypothetical protein